LGLIERGLRMAGVKSDGTPLNEFKEYLHGGIDHLVKAFEDSETKKREMAVVIELLSSKVCESDLSDLGIKRDELEKFCVGVSQSVEG